MPPRPGGPGRARPGGPEPCESFGHRVAQFVLSFSLDRPEFLPRHQRLSREVVPVVMAQSNRHLRFRAHPRPFRSEKQYGAFMLFCAAMEGIRAGDCGFLQTSSAFRRYLDDREALKVVARNAIRLCELAQHRVEARLARDGVRGARGAPSEGPTARDIFVAMRAVYRGLDITGLTMEFARSNGIDISVEGGVLRVPGLSAPAGAGAGGPGSPQGLGYPGGAAGFDALAGPAGPGFSAFPDFQALPGFPGGSWPSFEPARASDDLVLSWPTSRASHPAARLAAGPGGQGGSGPPGPGTALANPGGARGLSTPLGFPGPGETGTGTAASPGLPVAPAAGPAGGLDASFEGGLDASFAPLGRPAQPHQGYQSYFCYPMHLRPGYDFLASLTPPRGPPVAHAPVEQGPVHEFPPLFPDAGQEGSRPGGAEERPGGPPTPSPLVGLGAPGFGAVSDFAPDLAPRDSCGPPASPEIGLPAFLLDDTRLLAGDAPDALPGGTAFSPSRVETPSLAPPKWGPAPGDAERTPSPSQ